MLYLDKYLINFHKHDIILKLRLNAVKWSKSHIFDVGTLKVYNRSPTQSRFPLSHGQQEKMAAEGPNPEPLDYESGAIPSHTHACTHINRAINKT